MAPNEIILDLRLIPENSLLIYLIHLCKRNMVGSKKGETGIPPLQIAIIQELATRATEEQKAELIKTYPEIEAHLTSNLKDDKQRQILSQATVVNSILREIRLANQNELGFNSHTAGNSYHNDQPKFAISKPKRMYPR